MLLSVVVIVVGVYVKLVLVCIDINTLHVCVNSYLHYIYLGFIGIYT